MKVFSLCQMLVKSLEVAFVHVVRNETRRNGLGSARFRGASKLRIIRLIANNHNGPLFHRIDVRHKEERFWQRLFGNLKWEVMLKRKFCVWKLIDLQFTR